MGRFTLNGYGNKNQRGNGTYFTGINPNQEGGIYFTGTNPNQEGGIRQVGGVYDIDEGKNGWWDHQEYDPEADNDPNTMPDWRPYPPPSVIAKREQLERERLEWEQRNSLKNRLKRTKEGLQKFSKDLSKINSLKGRSHSRKT